MLMHTYLLKHGLAYVSLWLYRNEFFEIEKFDLLLIHGQRQLIQQTKLWLSIERTIEVFGEGIAFCQKLAAATNYCLLELLPTSA